MILRWLALSVLVGAAVVGCDGRLDEGGPLGRPAAQGDGGSASTGEADAAVGPGPGSESDLGPKVSAERDGAAADVGAIAADAGPDPAPDVQSPGPPSDCPRLRVDVSAGGTLNVRPMPSTSGDAVGHLPDNAI